jgi:septum formation protein
LPQTRKKAQRVARDYNVAGPGEIHHVDAVGLVLLAHLMSVEESPENSAMTFSAGSLLSVPSGGRKLVLGSTSRYRRELLERLRIAFDVASPEVDEEALPGESPASLSVRLADAKAAAVAKRFPEAVVIGSDQVADLDGIALGKPGNHANAVAQLRTMSSKSVVFHTAVTVRCGATGFCASDRAEVRVRFRKLTDREIESYLHAEQPYDCAGSAKSEGLGISLLDAIESDDPTALIGLPLIRTCQLLRAAGLHIG